MRVRAFLLRLALLCGYTLLRQIWCHDLAAQPLCTGARLFATYRRTTFTPVLILRNATDSAPCGLLKLSCRLWSNAEELSIVDHRVRTGRAPFGTETWADLVTHFTLSKSPLARASLVPHSYGIVLHDVLSLFESASEFKHIPATCFAGDGVVTGQLQSFVPGVRGASVHAALSNLSAASVSSLAVTLLADALTLNTDRSDKRNMFALPSGELISLDNCCPSCWRFDCIADLAQHMEQLIDAPNFLKHTTSTPCDSHSRQLYARAQAMAHEICAEKDCSSLGRYLQGITSADAWFTHVDAHRPDGKVHNMCCVQHRSEVIGRTCRRCAGPFSHVVNIPVSKTCFDRTAADFATFLSFDAAARMAVITDVLDQRLASCG
jgi:hypothetical protein